MDRGWSDVAAHRDHAWWKEPGGWEQRWSADWNWS
jgi:hypothetical protein